MADAKISALTAISAVDAATDVIAIVDISDNQTKKATRNTFLNIASQPLGLTDTQSPTNKTFDNTNVLTVKDANFTLQDDSDATKQAKFQLSSITTGTTRTYTLPDTSDIIVTESATQGMANKTLTSPTINTATIVNPTITADSIAEYTSANGVTIDGLNLKDGKLNTNNSVVTANITDTAVTPAKLQTGTGSGWAWASWTPTWSSLTVGNGTVTARYMQTGKTVFARLSVVFGSTTSISGDFTFTLPVTAAAHAGAAALPPLGWARAYDVSAAVVYEARVLLNTTTTTVTRFMAAGGTYVTQVTPSSTVPFTWTNPDELSYEFVYEAA
jgi:hypothetical protein